jgi:hypothetical protein
MPLFVIVFSTIMAFIVVESINFLPTLLAGTYVGWIYLRYFQKNPLTGLRGDPSDDFSFPTFFPDFMRPVTEPVANVFDKLCCARSRAGHQALPVSDPSKASRRRERGEKALEQRLAGENAASTGGAIEVTSHGDNDTDA